MELALSPSSAVDGDVDVFHPLNLHRKPYTSILPSLLEELSLAISKIKNSAGGSADIGSSHATTMEAIPLDKWIFRVRQDLENQSKLGVLDTDGDLGVLLKANPAVKLVDFYELLSLHDRKAKAGGMRESDRIDNDMPSVFETSVTAGNNSTLRAIPGVSRDWIAKWVGEWSVVWTPIFGHETAQSQTKTGGQGQRRNCDLMID